MSGIQESEETRQNQVVILPASVQGEEDISPKLWSVLLEDSFFEDVSLDEFREKLEKITVYLSSGKLLESPSLHKTPGTDY